MTRHTITTWTDELGAEVAIEYDFSAAEPDVNYPDTIEFVGARASVFNIGQAPLDRWAETWLHNQGYELAVANAARSGKQ